jgi:hypothetical protein
MARLKDNTGNEWRWNSIIGVAPPCTIQSISQADTTVLTGDSLQTWYSKSIKSVSYYGSSYPAEIFIGVSGGIDNNNGYGSVEAYFQSIRVRKYISPEPAHGVWGTEELLASPNQTTQTLPSTVGVYYWHVKTWDSGNAEGPYSAGRIVMVDRIKTTACGILNNVVDTRTGGAVWYTAVYESDSTPFTSTCGTLYLNSVAMVWATDRWTYTFPYQMSGSQTVFHVTSVAESTYGLTGLNNVAGDLVLNWATMEISIVKP